MSTEVRKRFEAGTATEVGPYEHWVFGGGALYETSPTYDADVEAHVAIAEWREPVPIGGLESELQSGTSPVDTTVDAAAGTSSVEDGSEVPTTTAFSAILAPPERLTGRLRFLPLVLETETNGIAPRDRDAVFMSFLSAVKDFRTSQDGDPGSEPTPKDADGDGRADDLEGLPATIRVNLPLAPDALNEAYFKTGGHWDTSVPSEETTDETLFVVGVIDDGLPFAHAAFLGEGNRTRVDHCWIQAARGSGANSVPFGAELTGGGIDALRAEHSQETPEADASVAVTDEDAVYADPASFATSDDEEIGRNIFRNYTHGAHVMERAAGFVPEDFGYEERDRVRVVGVQLPRGSLRDTTGFGKDVFILSGIHYVLDRAERIARARGATKVELLINVSLGVSGGPKNGRAQLERAIDDVVAAYRNPPPGETASRFTDIRVVMPSGNDFAARLNAELPMPEEGETGSFQWRVQPNDRTASYLELWMDDPGSDLAEVEAGLTLSITMPDGEAASFELRGLENAETGAMHPTIRVAPLTSGGETIGQVSLDRYAGRLRYMVILAPTAHEPLPGSDLRPTAPAGLWTIALERTGAGTTPAGATIDCRIQRDEDPAGTRNGGRQSYFDHAAEAIDDPHVYPTHDRRGRRVPPDPASYPATEEHDPQPGRARITGFGSMNGWATRFEGDPKHRIAVGGFVGERVSVDPRSGSAGRAVEPSTYSGAGSSDPNGRPRVDHAAQSDRSVALAGVRGAGTRSGATTVIVGTSAAAPAYLRSRVLQGLGSFQGHVEPRTARLGAAVKFARKPREESQAQTRPAPAPTDL